MFLEQLKCERLVPFRESAVADHVREHDRGELAMFGAVLRHVAKRPEEFGGPEFTRAEFARQKILGNGVHSSWLTASQDPARPFGSFVHIARIPAAPFARTKNATWC